MPMHRSQRFDAAQPSIVARDYPSFLRAVFRGAVGCALASTLAASGCSATATAPDDDASKPGGGGGQVATAGVGGSRSGGNGGVGGQLVATAGSGSAGSGSAGSGSAGTSPPTAGSGAAGAGSAGSDGAAGTTANPMPPDGSVTPRCDGATLQLLDGITPGEPFDGAELRMQFLGSMPETTAASGELCSAASDQAACRAAIAAAESTLPHTDVCGMIGDCDRYVVTTSGDDVRMYASRADLLRLLGTIDSPEDVALLLAYDRYDVLCADASRAADSGGTAPSTILAVADGFEAAVVLNVSTCPFQYAHVTLHVAPDGTVTELTRELLPEQSVCAGRRPEGLRSQHLPSTGSSLGAYFARMAHLEAASVTAFEVLAEELAHHGAPAGLVASATRAAHDEVRHTALTTALARRFGAEPMSPSIAPRPLRSLEAIALDNAVEGCVRECFGAVLGCYQAETSSDAEVAHVMTAIAEDETRHAALAFELAAWVEARLDPAARARVQAARRTAADALRLELWCTPDEPTRHVLGLPDRRAAQRLHQTLERALWAA